MYKEFYKKHSKVIQYIFIFGITILWVLIVFSFFNDTISRNDNKTSNNNLNEYNPQIELIDDIGMHPKIRTHYST